MISYIVYIIAILQGRAKPHRTTRFCTAIITVLAMISLFVQGSPSALWLSIVFSVGSLIIFILSIWRGMGGWAKEDIFCLVISILGIIFWKSTSNPVYGLAFFIGADFVGQIPMLIKTYRLPKTEVWMFYFLDVVAAVCTIFAAPQWTIQELLYPLYVIALDSTIIYFIVRL